MWPFDKKTNTAQEQVPLPTFWDPNNVGAQQGLIGNGGAGYPGLHIGGGGAGGGAVGNSSGTWTPSQLNALLGGMFGITKEEQEELATLKRERATEIKAVRIIEFKKIPTELRQFVINAFSWQEAVTAINAADVPLSDRLKDLTIKEQQGRYTTHASVFSYPYDLVPSAIKLPEGLTIEDLKNAHIEQTLEEEMLDV